MCNSAIQDEWLALWANPPLSSFHPTQTIWLTNRGGGALCLIILQLLVLLTLFALLLQLIDPFLALFSSTHLLVKPARNRHDTTSCVLLSLWREMSVGVVLVTYLGQDREKRSFYSWSYRLDRVSRSEHMQCGFYRQYMRFPAFC